jgi:DNA repair exonuclease SbcCD ATPase subunit
MFDFIDARDSERAKTFQYLCGVEIAAQIHKVCNDYVNKQKGVEIVDNSLELTDDLEKTNTEIRQTSEQAEESKKQILTPDTVVNLQKIVRREEVACDAEQGIEAQQTKVKLLKSQADQLETSGLSLYGRCGQIQAQLERTLPKVELAHAKINAVAAYRRAKAQINELTDSMQKKMDCVQSLLPPAMDSQLYLKADERETAAQRLSELRAILEAAEPESLADSVCRYCQQEISEKHRKKLLKEIETTQQEFDALKQRVQFSQSYDKEKAAYDTQVNRMTAGINEIRAQLDVLVGAEDPGADTKAREFLNNRQQLTQELATVNTEIAQLEKTKAKTTSDLQHNTVELEKQQEKIKQRPTKRELESATSSLKLHYDAVAAVNQLDGALRVLEQTKQRIEANLHTLRKRLEKHRKTQELLKIVEEAGNLFHWSNLPKAVAQANLGLLVQGVNENLELFGTPFTVQADQDLTFQVTFPGQYSVKASQLSGGQKVILAVAFRTALGRVFGHDVGMLFLDEPASGLDADNVTYFHSALQQLASKMGTQQQMVIITHVHDLQEVFEQSIEIRK